MIVLRTRGKKAFRRRYSQITNDHVISRWQFWYVQRRRRLTNDRGPSSAHSLQVALDEDPQRPLGPDDVVGVRQRDVGGALEQRPRVTS